MTKRLIIALAIFVVSGIVCISTKPRVTISPPPLIVVAKRLTNGPVSVAPVWVNGADEYLVDVSNVIKPRISVVTRLPNGQAKVASMWFNPQEYLMDHISLTFDLRVEHNTSPNGQNSAACAILVTNRLEKAITCWAAEPTSYLRVALLDSNRVPVKKTAEGDRYGIIPSDLELQRLIQKHEMAWRPRHGNSDGFAFIGPPWQVARFDLPALFELSQPGDYTLKVQMRLILLNDTPPDQGFRTMDLIWLPEVTAKIKIRADEIRAAGHH